MADSTKEEVYRKWVDEGEVALAALRDHMHRLHFYVDDDQDGPMKLVNFVGRLMGTAKKELGPAWKADYEHLNRDEN